MLLTLVSYLGIQPEPRKISVLLESQDWNYEKGEDNMSALLQAGIEKPKPRVGANDNSSRIPTQHFFEL